MTKNCDDYKESEDIPLKMLSRCRIISHEAPGYLVMLMEYWDSIEDADDGKTTAINFAISVDAADMLGAALIDSAKKRREEPESEN
jgi:hypothetical protein